MYLSPHPTFQLCFKVARIQEKQPMEWYNTPTEPMPNTVPKRGALAVYQTQLTWQYLLMCSSLASATRATWLLPTKILSVSMIGNANIVKGSIFGKPSSKNYIPVVKRV